MGTAPQFLDVFIDQTQAFSQWVGNSSSMRHRSRLVRCEQDDPRHCPAAKLDRERVR